MSLSLTDAAGAESCGARGPGLPAAVAALPGGVADAVDVVAHVADVVAELDDAEHGDWQKGRQTASALNCVVRRNYQCSFEMANFLDHGTTSCQNPDQAKNEPGRYWSGSTTAPTILNLNFPADLTKSAVPVPLLEGRPAVGSLGPTARREEQHGGRHRQRHGQQEPLQGQTHFGGGGGGRGGGGKDVGKLLCFIIWTTAEERTWTKTGSVDIL